ncbi:hypothetical protein M3210_05065 [Oceanobacillus luteolus]|uniref:DUF3899 domain-containing protein n=1 Tax=Oceanobacillus luteolus TaxID=1274358 RepID=A0ABW4HRZ1_9BACI|nr:hypothetical protein [Oceanobacillus luteolus]MCM3739634.1 hypothetical protein [Oceanobacillus luteolus]
MNAFTVGLIIVVCLVATVITYRVLKEEEQKQKAYEESSETFQDEFNRSLEYERTSWKTNIPLLTWIYIIATLASLIALVIYMV